IEAILRVYNLLGRRDNLHKARLKILVRALGIDRFREAVEAEWQSSDKAKADLPEEEFRRIAAYFTPPDLPERAHRDDGLATRNGRDPRFANWRRHNVLPHRTHGYCSVVVSLKEPGRPPGDVTSDKMELVADLAERFGHDQIRVNYTQNLVLPHVALADVPELYDRLVEAGLATGSNELLGDMICCPGLDYCNLASARSIPVAKEIAKMFDDPARQDEIGKLRLNLSGCINACGHHHAGNIGILGVDKKGSELYQITIGGSPNDDAAIGTIIGPGFRAERVPDAVGAIVDTYVAQRHSGESFLETWHRVGAVPFKEALYGSH
ncbi:MAG: nitrite/sulfite reductase, partial [Pseudomonadota bacterium]